MKNHAQKINKEYCNGNSINRLGVFAVADIMINSLLKDVKKRKLRCVLSI